MHFEKFGSLLFPPHNVQIVGSSLVVLSLVYAPSPESVVCLLPAGLHPRAVCPPAVVLTAPRPPMSWFSRQLHLLCYFVLSSVLYLFHAPCHYQQNCHLNTSSFTADGSVADSSLLQSPAKLSIMSNCRS